MEFWKKGSYKDALKDFKKLKPTNVKNDKVISLSIVTLETLYLQLLNAYKVLNGDQYCENSLQDWNSFYDTG